MRNGMLVFVLSALALVGVAQTTPTPPPVTPIPPITIVIPIPMAPLCLDLSQATFSQPPGASEGIGAWFIPVQGLSDILNAPPSRDTPIGITIAGPKLGILYFRVEGGIAFLRWSRPVPPIPLVGELDWARAQARWVPMGPGVTGKIEFGLGDASLLFLALPEGEQPQPEKPEGEQPKRDPWWRRLWPDSIEIGHKPDCTWYIRFEW